MTINELIAELRKREIILSYSGGKLKYSGPKENITNELVEEIRQNKWKLIKYMWPRELGNLMPINPEGSQVPLFIIHGDNSNYLISSYLGPDQPVFGFFHPGSEGEGIHFKSVKKMAKDYLDMIISVQNTGSYFLIGYSFGGVLAFEIAVQLQKMGRKVPFLVLIDSLGPLAREPVIFTNNYFKLVRYNILRPVRRYLKRAGILFICNCYLFFKKPIPVSKRNYYLWIKYSGLTLKYFPGKFDGNMLLFRASEQKSSNRYLGWETLVNNISIIEIEGHHLDIFKEKDKTDTLLREIKNYLENVRKADF